MLPQNITVLPNGVVTVFTLVFTLCTFYDCCNASRSAFLYRGALNTLIVLYCIVMCVKQNVKICVWQRVTVTSWDRRAQNVMTSLESVYVASTSLVISVMSALISTGDTTQVASHFISYQSLSSSLLSSSLSYSYVSDSQTPRA